MSGRLQLLILLALLALWVFLGVARRDSTQSQQQAEPPQRLAWIFPTQNTEPSVPAPHEQLNTQGDAWLENAAPLGERAAVGSGQKQLNAQQLIASEPSLLPRQKFGFVANESVQARHLMAPVDRRSELLHERQLSTPPSATRRQPLSW